MTSVSHCDGLTIPELFRALKQRLCGISSNWIRCVAPPNPRTRGLTCMLHPATLRDSTLRRCVSGLANEDRRRLITQPHLGDFLAKGGIRCPLVGTRFEESVLSRLSSPGGSTRAGPRDEGFGTRPSQSLTRLPPLARHPHILSAPLDQIPVHRRGANEAVPHTIPTCSYRRHRGF